MMEGQGHTVRQGPELREPLLQNDGVVRGVEEHRCTLEPGRLGLTPDSSTLSKLLHPSRPWFSLSTKCGQ